MSQAPLNPFTLPLDGSRLIEASAGTGKTYTLAALYVRLVLGLGSTAFADGLPPEQILVLTFTRAATRELRQRIRERLDEAAAVLNHGISPRDPFMEELLAACADNQQALAKRCTEAARQMDKAGIYTIHSFCQRVLKRFAFAARQTFEQELETDTAGLTQQAFDDYWRQFIQQQPATLANQLNKEGLNTPARLKNAANNEIDTNEATEQQPLPDAIGQFVADSQVLSQLEDKAVRALRQEQQQLNDWLDAMLAGKYLSKKTCTAKRRKILNDAIDTGDLSRVEAVFTPTGLRWNKHKQQDIPANIEAALNELAVYLDAKAEITFPREALLTHAANWTDVEIERQLESRAHITYDSMITALQRALENNPQRTLANQLFDAWPCTLIDEFQDTDPAQYAIFQHIYRDRDASAYLWLVIGDPKQAIYGFRGADIDIYIDAKEAIAESHRHTLGTNFRSSQGMVDATNCLFDTSPLSDTEAGVFGHELIPFQPVAANGRNEIFEIDGEPVSPMTLVYPPFELQSTGACQDALAEVFANQIAELLVLGKQNRAGFRALSDNSFRPLRPQDITLLVRTGSQAKRLQSALSHHNISAVFLSDKTSIYASDEAQDLLTLLEAIAQPHDARLIRNALVTPLLNYSLDELTQQLEDDAHWQTLLTQFRAFHDQWQYRGVLAMLHQLVHELDLPQRQKDERTLTNLFHLAELLQDASQQLDGKAALLHYFATAIVEQTKSSDDSPELAPRLESERERLSIVTLHQSKGLEYPLVMMPFVSIAPDPKLEDDVNESMRLLYVGVTRARHACWVGLALNKRGAVGKSGKHQLETTAIGRLLFGEAHINEEAMDERLAALADGQTITLDREVTDNAISAPDETRPALLSEAPELPTRRPPYWRVTSYSGLYRQRSSSLFRADLERLDEEDDNEAASQITTNSGIHAFERGAAAGNLLHALLEAALQPDTRQQLMDGDQPNRQSIQQLVERFCRQPQWQDAQPLLADWLEQLLFTPLRLPEQTAQLIQLDAHLTEAEFWLRTDTLDTTELDALAAQLLPGERPLLDEKRLSGMLKGFIDLLFCVDGRYYVLDYKSNWLGANDTAYTQENMAQAMLSHRYELQALIYQQALHRLLQRRLPNYDPAQHLGGAVYFFLRGINADSQGLFTLPAQVQLLDAMETTLNQRQPTA